jgi:hypothetical protein
MPIFTRKPELSIEEFCRAFYERAIFNPEFTVAAWDAYFDELAKVDATFSRVPRDLFYIEMTALRLELFALALLHVVRSDDIAVRQHLLTDRYLSANDHADVRAAGPDYADAVAESALDIATNEKSRERRALHLNGYHIGVYKQLAKRMSEGGIRDPKYYDALKATINRYDTDGPWRRGLTGRRLALTLAKRLSIDPNGSASRVIQIFIRGMYDGATGAISEVRMK